jgi:hypothetical protein
MCTIRVTPGSCLTKDFALRGTRSMNFFVTLYKEDLERVYVRYSIFVEKDEDGRGT